MTRLLVTWKDPSDSLWKPVATLDQNESGYSLRYTDNAKELSRFTPFGLMNDLDKKYSSTELFPMFSNRLLPTNRPEYQNLIDWLDLEGKDSPFSVLAATHGERATDSLKLFQCPTLDSNQYVTEFFVQGLPYLGEHTQALVEGLKAGEKLFFMDDYQNESSDTALAIRTNNPKTMIGYCPNFLARDIGYLSTFDKSSKLVVKKVNSSAPANFKLLCSFEARPPKTFKPFGQNYMA